MFFCSGLSFAAMKIDWSRERGVLLRVESFCFLWERIFWKKFFVYGKAVTFATLLQRKGRLNEIKKFPSSSVG